jgi:hypothetical protein
VRLFADRHYEAHLEDEVRRLRAENRALTNSILGLAGAPPVIEQDNEKLAAPQRKPRNWREIGRTMTERTRRSILQTLHGNGEKSE